MSASTRTVLLVGHDEATRLRLEVRARLLGLEPVSCITGEAALARAEAGPLFAVISDLVLPGAGGLPTLAELERRWPGTHTVLLSDIPPGLSPAGQARLRVDTVLVRRGAWEAAVVQAAFPGLAPAPGPHAALSERLDTEDREALAELLLAGELDEATEALALTHLAASAPRPLVLPTLERLLGAPPARPARFEAALAAAEGLGEAGLEVVLRVLDAEAAPAPLRGRAARVLGARAPLAAARAGLEPWVGRPEVGLDAAEALLEAAVAAGGEGFEVLSALAGDDAAPGPVRAAALDRLFEAFSRTQVAPLLSALTRAAPPDLKAHASLLLARADEFSVEALVSAAEDPGRPLAERRGALARAAADLPKAEALALLERAQVSPEPALRGVGFELAASRADTDFEATFARAVQAGAGALQAVLLGLMKLGPRAAPALEAMVRAPWVPAPTRGQALRLLALRFPPARVAPVVQEVLRGEDAGLHGAAVLAALQLGRVGWALLYSTSSAAASAEVRATALAALDRHAPVEVVQDALRRASRDPDPGVRWAAVRAAARRAGAELGRILPALSRAQEPALFEAALDGARALGAAGFQGLAALAVTPEVPRATRQRALAVLAETFSPDEVAPVLAAAGLPPSEASPAAAPVVAPGRGAAPARDAAAPARAAVPRGTGRGPRVEAWEVAETRPTPPAQEAPADRAGAALTGAAPEPEAPPASRLVRAGTLPPAARPPPDQPPVGGAPAEGPGAAAQARWSAELPSEAPTQPAAPATRPDPPAGPTAATPPARAASPVLAPAPPPVEASPVAEPAPPADATTWLPSGRVRPPARRERQVSLRRAEEALSAALRLGRDGYRGLRTLADSPRIPLEVRVQALRHLAADFGDRDLTPALERALGAEAPALQNAALSCVMLRRDVAMGPLVGLATRPDAELATRARAVRFMASRFPKAETRATFEALLESAEPDLRRAALESLFTSMRFVPPEQVEAGLVNILKEHHEVEVRISAARALGAFGGPAAQAALRSVAGLFAEGVLKDAARAALERLQARGV